MMKHMLVLGASCVALVLSAAIPVAAQSAQSTDLVASQSMLPQVAETPVEATSDVTTGLGPTLAPAAFHSSASKSAFIVTAQDGPHGGLGNNLAYVLVGAVGTIVGINIGGGAGGTIAVAGAGVALYGLYRMLR